MVSINDEVELTNERIGRVRYVGPLDGKNGIFYGIELTQGTGKHNGSHRGKRYFQCNKGKGIFVTKKNLKYKLEPTAKNKDEKKKKTASKKAGPSQKKKSKSGKKEKFTMPDYMDILDDDTGFLEYIPRHRGNLQSKTIYPTAGYLPFAQRRKKLYKQDINDVQQEIEKETAMIEYEKLRIQSKQKELDKKAESMNDQQRKEADKQRIALQEESDRLKKFDTKRQQKRDEIEAERKKLRLWEMEMAENMEKEEKDRLDQLKKEQMRRKMMLKKQKELERQRSRLADGQKESETKQRIAIQEEMAQIEAAKDALYKEEAIRRRMAEEKELERQAKWEREEADRLRALRAAQDALKLKMEAEQLRLEEERMRMEREREIKRKLELEKLKNEQQRTQLLEKQKREIEDMKNMLERLKIEQEQTAKRKLEQEEAMLAKLEKKRAELEDARTALKTEMIKMAQLEKERENKINDDVVMDKEKRLEKENGLKRMNGKGMEHNPPNIIPDIDSNKYESDDSDMIGSSDESDDEEMIRRPRRELEPYREREREICVCKERRMPGNIPECGLHHCGLNEFDDMIQRKSLPEYKNPIYPTPKASVSEPEEAKNDESHENGLEDDAGSGSEKDDYNGAVSELKNRKHKESKAALRDYKIFFSVNIETKENDKDIIGDTKSLRPLLSDLFDTYSENDVFEIKTRQKGNGFKIDFGIIIATSMHPADYIDTFDDLTMDGSFQETIQNGFNLTNNPIIHIWEARYEKIDPNKQRKRKN